MNVVIVAIVSVKLRHYRSRIIARVSGIEIIAAVCYVAGYPRSKARSMAAAPCDIDKVNDYLDIVVIDYSAESNRFSVMLGIINRMIGVAVLTDNLTVGVIAPFHSNDYGRNGELSRKSVLALQSVIILSRVKLRPYLII